MITPKRLEQLLGKKIYHIFIDDYPINEVKVNKTYIDICDWYENLFETKEDAEFALRYKRIPKTEYLDLPEFEEMCYEECELRFINSNWQMCSLSYETELGGNNYIAVYQNKFTLFRETATKENYIEACELCRKLWLGEEV